MSQDNKKEVHSEPEKPDQGVEFAHRRQVIRGMASIPVALTLSSGAALANASSHACVTEEDTMEIDLPDCGDDPNSILLKDWRTSAAKITPDANDPAKPAGHCVAYAQESMPPGDPEITGFLYKSGSTSTFVDASGDVIDDGSTIGNPLRASCATSFLP